MRIPREVWWIAGLTTAAVLLVVLLGGRREAPEAEGLLPNRTTYSSSPTGLRGMYLALGRLGYEVGRLRRPLTSANLPAGGTLFVVEPLQPPLLSQAEEADLRRWVAGGRTLVLCGGPTMPTMHCAEAGADEAGFPLPFREPAWSEARPAQPVYLMSGVRRLAVRSADRIRLAEHGPGGQTEDEADRCGVSDGGSTSELSAGLARAAPVARDEHGAVVAYARIGQGQLVMLASPWSLSNEGIDKACNFRFVLNAVGAPESGPVYFDEYHHGYAENVTWGLLPGPVKLALAQVVVGLLLVMYARSRRLGPVVPLMRQGRQRTEFLGTMATVLRRGHATGLAVQTAQQRAVGQLRSQLGLARDADEEAIVAAVARSNPDAAARLEKALSELRAALAGPAPTEVHAMELIRQCDEAVAAARRI